ncbi:MAG: avirulence protein [Bacteroidetes bacterium]|nr:avirulence protein [Bacteroidota bacterium]
MKDRVLRGCIVSIIISAFSLWNNAIVSGQENIAPKAVGLETSYVSGWETLGAINDGVDPASSMDESHDTYGNWQAGVSNKWNWVQYDFDLYYVIDQSNVYWWTDQADSTSTVGVQMPYDSYLQYWDMITHNWVEVKNPVGYGVKRDQYNVTTFDPVLTNKIRLHFVSVSAQGIIEWQVMGKLGEQIPVHSSAAIDPSPAKNTTHTVTLVARDTNDVFIEGYVFRADVLHTDLVATNHESYTINGLSIASDTTDLSLSPTNASGTVSFTLTTPDVIDPTDGICIHVQFNDGLTGLASWSLYEPGLASPVLSADTLENNVDHTIEIDFADDADWRNAISKVTVNGRTLVQTIDFETEAGKINLKPSGGNAALTSAGSKEIIISAPGYEDSKVMQIILAGQISTEKSGLENIIKLYKGNTTTLTLAARDKFENAIGGYTFKWDAEVFDTTAITAETYIINSMAVTGNLSDQVLPSTGADGKVSFTILIPSKVDLNDGIAIQFQLDDGLTNVDSLIRYFSHAGEKQVYIASDLKTHEEWSWEKTAQSENFILFWGDLSGTDPRNPENGNDNIAFDPVKILSKLEGYLSFYVDSLNFITNPTEGNMAKYKFIIVICNTWADGGYDGYATGGSWDDVIGAMWIHPSATGGSGFVIAHEFAHMCQAMIPIQYPGHGLKNKPGYENVGMFWESHANFLALTATDEISSVQPSRWVNTAMLHYSSTRHYYQAVYFPQYIVDNFGMEELNLVWRNAVQGDHPLESFRNNRGYTQEQLNDEFGYYAMKNVTWDYSIGERIRNYFNNQIDPIYVCREFTIMDTIPGKPGTYIVPKYLAPRDYGYNVVPLYPAEGSGNITITFSGYDNEPAGGAGWRYGFVAVDASGAPRYSALYSGQNETVNFTLEAGDEKVFFVVTGAPKIHHNYKAWEPGDPKIYRYPYNFQVEGALPAGYFKGYNSQKDENPGAAHANGGGWVASTASVESSVFVGPDAQVLGQATVTGSARIEDYAIVQDNAQVSGSAIIRGNAIIGKNAKVRNNAIVEKTTRVYTNCNISGNAIITGSAMAYSSSVRDYAIVKDLAIIDGATLSGDVIIGGDAEDFASCSSGTYLQLYKITGRSKGCDGNHEHILNVDVNPVISDYPVDTLVRTNTGIFDIGTTENQYTIFYNTENQNIIIKKAGGTSDVTLIKLITMDGRVLISVSDPSSDEISINVPAKGVVIVMVTDASGIHSEKLFIP